MRISGRGRVTIPKEIPDRFALNPETEVEFQVIKGRDRAEESPQKARPPEMEGPLQGQPYAARLHVSQIRFWMMSADDDYRC
jgi:bifunctional DNA-binding transcriptional regulator/antitoxin component of YhaV-PrlF toxin-antitoxin module